METIFPPSDNETNATKPSEMELPDHDYLEEEFLYFIRATNIISFSVTFFLGTLGNGLVIWIAGFKMKRTVNTVWFLNLSLADFIFNMSFPLQITEWAMEGHWPFGLIMCKVIFCVLYLNIFVSISFLVIISVDRCITVLLPVWSKNHRTLSLAKKVSVVTWMLCFALSFPYFQYYKIVEDHDRDTDHCNPVFDEGDHNENWKFKTMHIIQFLSMFVIPFSFILVCYTLILIRIRRRQSLSQSNRPIKIIVSIIFCFFFCWFPFHFWPLLEIRNDVLNASWQYLIANLSICLAFFNSCLNPMLYVFLGRDFKESFIKSIPNILERTFKQMDSDGEEQGEPRSTGTELSDSSV